MTLRLVAVGLVTLLGQVVLLREIQVASFGSELIYLLGIGFQLVGTATGVMSARSRSRDDDATIRAIFLMFGVSVPLLLALARGIRVIFGGTPGAYLSFDHQLAAIALVLVPSGFLGGFLFTRTARTFVARGWTLAAAYAIESAGGIIGGALSTLLVALGVRNLSAALICSTLAIAVTLAPTSRERGRWIPLTALPLLALAVFALGFSRSIDLRLTRINHPNLLDSADTPYGRATVTGSLGQVVVFENDALAFESQGTSAEELANIAALQVSRPDRVLLLGGAIEGLVPELLKHRPTLIEDVELDRALVETVRPYLPRDATRWEERSDARVVIGDPRRFLERPNRYDLIVSALPEPESGQANRYYTREFFETASRRLVSGGVFAFRLRSSENLWTPVLTRRAASIVGALRASFSDVVVLPGSVNIVIASNTRLPRDPRVLGERLADRRIQTRLVSKRYLDYLYTNDRRNEIERLLADTAAPINTDTRPICYQYTLVLWLSKFFPTLALANPTIDVSSFRGPDAVGLAVFAALLFVAFLALRRSIRARRILLVAIAGFAGMVFEGALLLGYQMREGVLYQNLGLLLTLFMSGLAVGSWSLDRIARRGQHDDGVRRSVGLGLLAGTAALGGFVAWSFTWRGGGLGSSALLLVAAGAATGALFAYASLRRVKDQAAAVAPLYAADLAGGCVGSIAGSLFLLPVLGLPATAITVAVLALTALSLV